jgi:hypothetical protein
LSFDAFGPGSDAFDLSARGFAPAALNALTPVVRALVAVGSRRAVQNNQLLSREDRCDFPHWEDEEEPAEEAGANRNDVRSIAA